MAAAKRELTLYFDDGSSLKKVLYFVDEGSLKYLTMRPACLEMPAHLVKELPQGSGMGSSENTSWVQLKKKGSVYLLGSLATNTFKSYPTPNYVAPKRKTIVPRILGVVGAIAEKEGLGDEFSLRLSGLLPYNEIEGREELGKQLKSGLKGFYYRQRRLQVELKFHEFRPEGSGVILMTSLEESGLLNDGYLCIGWGHRHTNLLTFRDGTLSREESRTTDRGFYHVIDLAIGSYPELSREDFMCALSASVRRRCVSVKEYSYELSPTTVDWATLAKHVYTDDAESLQVEMKKKLEKALDIHWLFFEKTIFPAFLRNIKVIVNIGGAYGLFVERLNNYFSNYGKVIYGSSKKQLFEELQMGRVEAEREAKLFLRENYEVRFLDLWCLLSYNEDRFRQ